ncbi:hypothetical protein PLICRDRAFT_36700 [Plicaturopsis crispa FD-325 SS-3]|nr:hypothetical protein PLICRDRAFT_36700 [Plicaturopsis crispa FD-325 SS-3]
MASRLALFATLLAVHSFASANAESSTITAAPPRRSPSHHDLAARQASSTFETTSPLPLTDYNYPFSAIPYQVNPFPIGRGPQSGYNLCNSTTEGANSQCQTLIVNSLSDFCLWGSPTSGGTIGDVEAAVVAYCAQSGHGARVWPAGTITGAQFMKTSAYIQITGHFNQSGIGLDPNDGGGELDPHGADLAGNPLGGLVYSTGMPSAKDNSTEVQVTSWNNFVGSGVFCIKLCDPSVTTPNYCENRFDLLGCSYNMPASYVDNEFTSCEGDLQEVVGTYTTNGQTITWSQPASLPATSTLPWTPVIPSSSNCQTFSSAQLFGSASGSGSSSASATSGGSKSTGTSKSSGTGTAAGSTASTSSSGAGQLMVTSGLFVVVGAMVALM